MNVPQPPLIDFLYWLINTPAMGGIAVGLVAGGSILAYGLALRWIAMGSEANEREIYAYPTPALLEHES